MCKEDKEKTAGLAAFILLSIITCGIYYFIWYYKIGNRLMVNAPRYGLTFAENGTSVLLWLTFGSLLCGIGFFMAMHILIKNTNAMAKAYNSNVTTSRDSQAEEYRATEITSQDVNLEVRTETKQGASKTKVAIIIIGAFVVCIIIFIIVCKWFGSDNCFTSLPFIKSEEKIKGIIVDPYRYTNVRSKASNNAKILAKVNKNDTFEIIEQKETWWKIKTQSGIIGYIHSSRIKVVDDKFNDSGDSLLKIENYSKVNKHINSGEYDKILDKKEIIAISKYIQNNPSYRIAGKADNHDKACLVVSKHPYVLKSNLTGKETKDIIACFIDSKIKPGEYKDEKGYKRLRGQFVIVVFSPSNKTDYLPFVIEKEFPLDKGMVKTNKANLFIQPSCESGPIISYKWEKGKFINDTEWSCPYLTGHVCNLF